MPQVTKENGLLDLVDRDTVLLGDITPKDIIHFEVEYKRSESTIEYIETTCPCIKAWYEGGKIKGSIDISKIVKGPYAVGATSVGKNITVFLNDGINRYIAAGNKQRQSHPLKKWFQILVTGVVVVS